MNCKNIDNHVPEVEKNNGIIKEDFMMGHNLFHLLYRSDHQETLLILQQRNSLLLDQTIVSTELRKIHSDSSKWRDVHRENS